MTATPGWYPDPRNAGIFRFFDGAQWTEHVAAAAPLLAPPWKGARLGRPPYGPGSLANPGRRLAARLLDGLFLAPIPIVLFVGVFVGAAHTVAGWTNGPPNQAAPVVGFVGLELSVFGILLLTLACSILYDALTTMRWGRSPGKAIMNVRPVRLDGTALSTGRAFGRAGAYYGAAIVQVLQLLDVLWCLWDDEVQCLHDKICDTLVVSDD